MIFAMPNKPGEFSRFDFPEVLPAPLNGKQLKYMVTKECLCLQKSMTICFCPYKQYVIKKFGTKNRSTYFYLFSFNGWMCPCLEGLINISNKFICSCYYSIIQVGQCIPVWFGVCSCHLCISIVKDQLYFFTSTQGNIYYRIDILDITFRLKVVWFQPPSLPPFFPQFLSFVCHGRKHKTETLIIPISS